MTGKTPTSVGLQLLPVNIVVLLGNKVTVLTTTLSHPPEVSKVVGKTPTAAGSQELAEVNVVSRGAKLIVVITVLSQPN